ncbi:hypothetical protein ES702_01476 [subsurface metagenome]
MLGDSSKKVVKVLNRARLQSPRWCKQEASGKEYDLLRGPNKTSVDAAIDVPGTDALGRPKRASWQAKNRAGIGQRMAELVSIAWYAWARFCFSGPG